MDLQYGTTYHKISTLYSDKCKNKIHKENDNDSDNDRQCNKLFWHKANFIKYC